MKIYSTSNSQYDRSMYTQTGHARKNCNMKKNFQDSNTIHFLQFARKRFIQDLYGSLYFTILVWTKRNNIFLGNVY